MTHKDSYLMCNLYLSAVDGELVMAVSDTHLICYFYLGAVEGKRVTVVRCWCLTPIQRARSPQDESHGRPSLRHTLVLLGP